MVSWWDQEIRIWVFQQPVEAIRGQVDEAEFRKNRRLLKKIIVDTNSNLSSVVISPDGSFLAASSALAGIRAWRLDHKNPTVPKEVRVTELTLPAEFSGVGAANLTISPDGHWLCMVEEGADVSIARISLTEGSKVLSLPQKTQRLKRLRRDVPRQKLLGGLGAYDRTITKTCFSPDSKMLATVDLAGYIDTWILCDADDMAQNGAGGSSSSMSLVMTRATLMGRPQMAPQEARRGGVAIPLETNCRSCRQLPSYCPFLPTCLVSL